ncbi:hypothetical protein CO044_01530 [Candidatus Peregrinibacteria bacterium CG_4_9_14_0_2_um_filter_38_9]|nr:MAG: hypothetical protein CO044_01530 [Candidatus Peregrinibacteria bacterium CG_4_9_14_0_2_um_filter_38_9]
MATKELQDAFFSALEASKSYSILSSGEQSELKTSFLTATDDQLKEGLEVIKRDAVEMEQIEAEAKKKAEEMKRRLKEELAAKIAKDKDESAMAAEKLLEQVENAPAADESDPKKRKKFLGIF